MIIRFLFLLKILFLCYAFSYKPSILKLRCNNNDYLNNLSKIKKKDDDNKAYYPLNKILEINYDTFFINAINKKIKKAYIPAYEYDRIIFIDDNDLKTIILNNKENISKILIILNLINNTKIVFISDYNFFNSCYSPFYYHK